MAQVTSVVSEALQRQVRTLLPSQEGFTEDLQAQNVIVPIVDLTSTAEGSSLPQYLQTAFTLTQSTLFQANNSTVNVVTTPGFYRIICTITARTITSAQNDGFLKITDGSTTKVIVQMIVDATNVGAITSQTYDIIVCLSAGETLQAKTDGETCFATGSSRQIAALDGTLINPTGFSPE